MNRYHLIIEYVGTNFKGWQMQKNSNTVQGTIHKIITKLTNEKVTIYGSGRTDAQVHAIGQSAHFDTKNKIQNLKKFLKSINYFLNKKDITIISIKKKPLSFHARYSVKKRIYKYIIYNRETLPSINRDRGWYIKNKLDLGLIKKASTFLRGTHDFSTFRASKCSALSPVK